VDDSLFIGSPAELAAFGGANAPQQPDLLGDLVKGLSDTLAGLLGSPRP